MNDYEDRPLLDTSRLLNRKKAKLPTAGVSDGAQAWCADGRKDGEAAAAGTGVPVYFNAATSTWFSFRTDAEVTV